MSLSGTEIVMIVLALAVVVIGIYALRRSGNVAGEVVGHGVSARLKASTPAAISVTGVSAEGNVKLTARGTGNIEGRDVKAGKDFTATTGSTGTKSPN